ncbi:hypothetical protein HAHE_04730 [Haloferula helveola]|uniref:LamG-like jellyroll fold domain-containing protein n=1 Tax=Haloferula helveola TaxID=490095 RepID=A0ABN6H4T0_9BACT|nr:hypothetical protein HAHE_04730 [Haloferula helveola]
MKSFPTPEHRRRWIENLLLDLREGRAGDEDVSNLRELLLDDPDARRDYIRANQLDCLLQSVPAVQQRQKRRWILPTAALGAAAVLTVALVVGNRTGDRHSPDTANADPASVSFEIGESFNAVADGSELADAGELGPGEHSLQSGLVELKPAPGITLVIEAPSRFSISHTGGLKLHQGRVWFESTANAGPLRLTVADTRFRGFPATQFGVSADGDAVVAHVLDGKTSFAINEAAEQALKGGFRLRAGIVELADEKDFDAYAATAEIARRRWEVHFKRMVSHPDLAFYLPFTDYRSQGKVLPNEAINGPELPKSVVYGASRVSGRIEGKGCLLFDRPNDAVEARLDEPFESRGFTIALWLNASHFSNRINSLVTSIGWEHGDIHLQVTEERRVALGIHEAAAFQSPRGTVSSGRWQFIAATYDPASGKAALFVDGRSITLSLRDNGIPRRGATPNFGDFQIGSWSEMTRASYETPPGTSLADGSTRPTISRLSQRRRFEGRIDEVLVFRRVLNSDELARIYEESKP